MYNIYTYNVYVFSIVINVCLVLLPDPKQVLAVVFFLCSTLIFISSYQFWLQYPVKFSDNYWIQVGYTIINYIHYNFLQAIKTQLQIFFFINCYIIPQSSQTIKQCIPIFLLMRQRVSRLFSISKLAFLNVIIVKLKRLFVGVGYIFVKEKELNCRFFLNKILCSMIVRYP